MHLAWSWTGQAQGYAHKWRKEWLLERHSPGARSVGLHQHTCCAAGVLRLEGKGAALENRFSLSGALTAWRARIWHQIRRDLEAQSSPSTAREERA